jgi:hypothetical protein
LQTTGVFGMIENMLQKLGVSLVLLTGVFLSGCGVSSWGADGSTHQTQTGTAGTGYPNGQPADAESPALSSSTEQQYSRAEAPEAVPAGENAPAPAK